MDSLPGASRSEFYDLRYHEEKSKAQTMAIASKSTKKKGHIASIGDASFETYEFERDGQRKLRIKYQLPVNFRHYDSEGREFLLPISSGTTKWELTLAPLIEEPLKETVSIRNSVIYFEKIIDLEDQETFGEYELAIQNEEDGAADQPAIRHTVQGDLSRSQLKLTPSSSPAVDFAEEKSRTRTVQQPKDIVLANASLYLEGKEDWKIDNNLQIDLNKTYSFRLKLQYKTPSIGQSGPTYRNVPDGSYKVGFSFLSQFYETFSIKNGSSTPLKSENLKTIIDTKENTIDVKNGEATLTVALRIPDIQLLSSRSLIVLDLYPVKSGIAESNRISRFILESVLKKQTLHRVAAANDDLAAAYERFDQYSKFLPLNYGQLQSLASKMRAEAKERTSHYASPEGYAPFINAELFSQESLVADNMFFEQLLKGMYLDQKLESKTLESLCNFWSSNIYSNEEVKDEKKLKKLKNKINAWCQFHVLSPMQQKPSVHNFFSVVPLYFNMDVLSAKNDGRGNAPLLNVSHAFSANKLDVYSYTFNTGAEVPLPVVKLGMSFSASKQDIVQETTATTSQYMLAPEEQLMNISVSKIKACILIRPYKQIVENGTISYTRTLLNWFPKVKLGNKAMLYCGQNLSFDKQAPLNFKTKFYFISQKFQSEIAMDASLLKNQPWLLQIRGEGQFNSLRTLIDAEAKQQAPLKELFSDPTYSSATDRLKSSFKAYGQLGLPEFPGVHYLRPGDLQEFQKHAKQLDL
jgi:hypothetical protein